jgi:hypothetical protein
MPIDNQIASCHWRSRRAIPTTFRAAPPAAAIWIASQSPATSWWRRLPAGSTSRLAICSSASKCNRVRTTIAMFVSGAAVITARSARLSCRTCSEIADSLGTMPAWFVSVRIGGNWYVRIRSASPQSSNIGDARWHERPSAREHWRMH